MCFHSALPASLTACAAQVQNSLCWLFLTIIPRNYSYQQLPFPRCGPPDCKDRGTTKLLRSGMSDSCLTATSTCIRRGQAGPEELWTTSVPSSRYHRKNRYSPERQFCSPCTLSAVCGSDCSHQPVGQSSELAKARRVMNYTLGISQRTTHC